MLNQLEEAEQMLLYKCNSIPQCNKKNGCEKFREMRKDVQIWRIMYTEEGQHIHNQPITKIVLSSLHVPGNVLGTGETNTRVKLSLTLMIFYSTKDRKRRRQRIEIR